MLTHSGAVTGAPGTTLLGKAVQAAAPGCIHRAMLCVLAPTGRLSAQPLPYYSSPSKQWRFNECIITGKIRFVKYTSLRFRSISQYLQNLSRVLQNKIRFVIAGL